MISAMLALPLHTGVIVPPWGKWSVRSLSPELGSLHIGQLSIFRTKIGAPQPGHFVVAMTGGQLCPAEQLWAEQGRGACTSGKIAP